MTGISSVEGIKYLTSPLFEPSRVAHAFLTRIGGLSLPPFDSLNFDTRDTDPKENVEENKAVVSRALGVDLKRLKTLNQVHGSSVLVLDEKNLKDPPQEVDAVITRLKGVPVGILTADCLPILIHDPLKSAIGAVHAGWKGTVKRVASKTIDAMNEAFGSKPENLIAALGPYIGPCCYGIREDAAKEFDSVFADTTDFMLRQNGEIRIDIGLANVKELLEAGLKKSNISMAAACTSCNSGVFFSYRKDGGRTGRQLSFIMIR